VTPARRWLVLALVCLGIVIAYVDRGNLSIAAPSIMRDFAIEPPAMGVLLSAFFWTYALFQIPAGAIIDRFGIRRAYAGGFLLWSLASASIALSRGPGHVIGMRMLLGVAESIAPLASLAFIRNNFAGKDRGLPTSLYIGGQSLGPAFGALVGAMLLDRFGWRMMFALTGLGALAWLPCWWFAVPRDAAPARHAPEKQRVATFPWREIVNGKTFWMLSLGILLSSYYWYFVLTWVPSYLILARGFTTLGMGHVVSTGLFAMAAANLASGFVADRLAARAEVFRVRLWFAVAGYVASALVLLLLVLTERAWVLPVLMFSMCATGTGNYSFWAIAGHVAPSKMAGRVIGYLNTLGATGGIVAPVVTGWILGPQKHFGPAILVAGVCPILAALCLVVCGSKGLERTRALLAGSATD